MLIGSYDRNLYALGAKDGKVLWKMQTEGYVHATPAVVDGIVYIAGCDEILRGIRVADGKEVLHVPSGAYTGASPAHRRGTRVTTARTRTKSWRSTCKTHKILWQYKNPDRVFPFYSSAAVSGERIVLGGRDKLVHELERQTGKATWTFPTRARVDSSPAVAGGRGLHRIE